MKNKTLLIIGGILLILGIVLVSSYNSLIDLKEEVETKSSDIEVQLERRVDLIPNLVNSVKGYMKHEDEVIDKITSAREKLTSASSLEEKANANNELTSALNNLYVIVENYPDLKSNTTFIQLQDELAGTENRIAVARKEYNNAVKEFNSKVKKFPTNILANMFSFKEYDYFTAKEGADETPTVNFE